MHKGMISGITASAIKTQTFVNSGGGVSFNSPIFKRIFNISISGGVSFGSSSTTHTINGTATFTNAISLASSVSGSVAGITGRVNFEGSGGIFIGDSQSVSFGTAGQWGGISSGGNITIHRDIKIGLGSQNSTLSTSILSDSTQNTLAIRNLSSSTSPQTFRVYRTTDSTILTSAPTNFERLELTWNTTGNLEAVLKTRSGGTGTARGLVLATNDIGRITIAANGDISVTDNLPINFGTTSGTQLGTTSSQKIAFWGSTPIVRPSGVAVPTGGATIDSECRASLTDLITKLQAIGLIS